MSIICQITKDLVKNYEHCLDQRLAEGASNLTCGDEVLRKDAEAILENAGAEDRHSLGLDSLKVMEESLKATAALPVSTARPFRRGLRGLAKAFEVLEQAALNLHLGPWRKEYKVVKMYSGIFTHSIKPVLSTTQITKLFGLLGYQPCIGQQDQLLRGRSGVHSTSPVHLLQLSCGFFLARCECQLLLAALGNHGGEAEWELGLVMERRRGHSLQVALDNTKKLLDTNQALTEEVPEECGAVFELDLYTAEELKSGRGETTAFHDDHGGPRSLSWVANHGGPPPPASIVLTHSNGFSTPSSSSSAAASGSRAREPRCVSTLNCQLSKTSPPRQVPSGATRAASAATKQAAPPDEDSLGPGYDRSEDRPSIAVAHASGMTKLEDSPEKFCGCVQPTSSCLKNCLNCKTLHDTTCASLRKCQRLGHSVVMIYKATEESSKTGPLLPQGPQEPGWCGPQSRTKDDASMSLNLCSTSDSIAKPPEPIVYHKCCEQALDPQYVCFTCKVFHSAACRESLSCEQHHKTKQLRVCQCGMPCSRAPLVLCRYCGTEYCSNCWYRNPVTCLCGQTFDLPLE